MDKHYGYLVSCAKRLMSIYPSKNIDGQDAEDFVMNSLANHGRMSWRIIKCDIIDAARSKWGRTDRNGPTRIYVELDPSKVAVNDGQSAIEQTQEVDDLLLRMPGLTQQQIVIVRGLAEGREQKDIAKDLGISAAAVAKALDRIVARLAENSEWLSIMSIHVSRYGSKNNRSVYLKEHTNG